MLLYWLARLVSQLETAASQGTLQKAAAVVADNNEGAVQRPDTAATLRLIKERRSIMPKDMTGEIIRLVCTSTSGIQSNQGCRSMSFYKYPSDISF